MSGRFRTDLEPEQNLVLVRQISDHAPQRRREPLDQRRRRQYPVVLGCLRLFQNVDDLKLVSAAQVLLADPPQVGDGGFGLRRLAGDVELQNVMRQGALLSARCRLDCTDTTGARVNVPPEPDSRPAPAVGMRGASDVRLERCRATTVRGAARASSVPDQCHFGAAARSLAATPTRLALARRGTNVDCSSQAQPPPQWQLNYDGPPR